MKVVLDFVEMLTAHAHHNVVEYSQKLIRNRFPARRVYVRPAGRKFTSYVFTAP